METINKENKTAFVVDDTFNEIDKKLAILNKDTIIPYGFQQFVDWLYDKLIILPDLKIIETLEFNK